jgi:predicted nucleic acid-binding protein
MSQVVVLDTNPLSQLAHPRINPLIRKWLLFTQENNLTLRVPEIADYEVRRELIRQDKTKSIKRLDEITKTDIFLPLNSEIMRKAGELWAWTRNKGKPTAHEHSLDGDVILVAQAISQLKFFDEVIIITTNLKHIEFFESQGVSVIDWKATLESLTSC